MRTNPLWMNVWNYLVSKADFWGSMLASHFMLVVWSSCIVIILGVPLGLLISRNKRLRDAVLGVIGVLYTIPILALFGFLIPLMGIGLKPALIALSIYGIMPVIRNTCVGIEQVSASFKEAADGMGANRAQILSGWSCPGFPCYLRRYSHRHRHEFFGGYLCRIYRRGGDRGRSSSSV